MNLLNVEFKRKLSATLFKNLKLNLAQMSFFKDFVNDKRGDLYPILYKSDNCSESVEHNVYKIKGGAVTRFFCQFFPYATYELSANITSGAVGFQFILSEIKATLTVDNGKLKYSCGDIKKEMELPDHSITDFTMIVTCRPTAFDVYFSHNGMAEYFCTLTENAFQDSNVQSLFTDGVAALSVSGDVCVNGVCSYIDSGISIADMRPIRYENSEIMTVEGKVYFTASIRLQSECIQGVFSWIPGTSEFDLTGALFYDSGDGRWCGDVAASILYHRSERKWYLWVCAFSHGHILGHSEFEGDPRFGVNVIDITLMEKAPKDAEASEFLAFQGDEDPDFFYDEENKRWLMAICRIDPSTRAYRYMFFESQKPFEDYRFIGAGMNGAETGGSFVRIDGELFFLCGNDFHAVSDYRIYHKNGMNQARFNYHDGGFRGWGTLMPIKMGSRTRYFWLTFDRHNGSDYNWSYGNLYCFEAN